MSETTGFFEVRTKEGQLLSIECDYEKREELKAAMKVLSEIDSLKIEEPRTRRILVNHGGYGANSRYKIKQHYYAGGGYPGYGGYVENLKIGNPPNGRKGIVIHLSDSLRGNQVFEFKSLRSAKKVFSETIYTDPESICKSPGFIRKFSCGRLTPWFYAVGDQQLMGDFAFPDSLIEESSIYRVGRKFALTDDDGKQLVKTCVGSWRKEEEDSYGAEKKYLVVQWTDGTQLRGHACRKKLQPLDETDPEMTLVIEKGLGRFEEQLPVYIKTFRKKVW